MSGITNPLTGEEIADNDLESLSSLCKRQRELEVKIEQLEAERKKLSNEVEELSTKLIPDKMDQLGMSSLRLSDGTKVEIKPFYSCKILDGGLKWLDENGHGGIIKTIVERKFSRQEREAAVEFAKSNPGFDLVESVHHSTLGAFVREIYSHNESLPEQYFSVYQGSRTKLTT